MESTKTILELMNSKKAKSSMEKQTVTSNVFKTQTNITLEEILKNCLIPDKDRDLTPYTS